MSADLVHLVALPLRHRSHRISRGSHGAQSKQVERTPLQSISDRSGELDFLVLAEAGKRFVNHNHSRDKARFG